MDWSQFDDSLNVAHKEQRKASAILIKKEPNYMSALESHQKAHALLRKKMLEVMDETPNAMDGCEKSLMASLQAQLDFHTIQQSVILNKQKREIIELKRQPYIASIQERHTAEIIKLILDEHSKITQKLSENDSLLETLEDINGDPHVGKKRPKSSKETLEELHNTNEELKRMLAALLDANINLFKENESLRGNLKCYKRIESQENTYPSSSP